MCAKPRHVMKRRGLLAFVSLVFAAGCSSSDASVGPLASAHATVERASLPAVGGGTFEGVVARGGASPVGDGNATVHVFFYANRASTKLGPRYWWTRGEQITAAQRAPLEGETEGASDEGITDLDGPGDASFAVELQGAPPDETVDVYYAVGSEAAYCTRLGLEVRRCEENGRTDCDAKFSSANAGHSCAHLK